MLILELKFKIECSEREESRKAELQRNIIKQSSGNKKVRRVAIKQESEEGGY